jgi:hypothetical protein
MKSLATQALFVCVAVFPGRPYVKWWSRYQKLGMDGLQEESRRPKLSPAQKVQLVHEQLIADLRKRKLGHRRIQNELKRLHTISFSTATIHKVLERINKPLLKIKRSFSKKVIR